MNDQLIKQGKEPIFDFSDTLTWTGFDMFGNDDDDLVKEENGMMVFILPL